MLGARAASAADVEGNEYTTYVVRCAYVEDGGRVSWEVRRRYQDFFMLHAKLRRYGAVAASLPVRHPFAKLASVVRHREVELHLYLQAILDHCNDKQCSYLAKFLQVQKNLPRYQERVQTAGGAGHRGMCNSGNGEGRGRSPKGAAVGRGRAQSLPRGFGKRTREVVDGVPRSSSKDAVVAPRSSSKDAVDEDPPATSATGAGVGACQACTNAAAAASCPGVWATGRIFPCPPRAAEGVVAPPITET